MSNGHGPVSTDGGWVSHLQNMLCFVVFFFFSLNLSLQYLIPHCSSFTILSQHVKEGKGLRLRHKKVYAKVNNN
jgi:hypothetical protein